MTTNHEVEQKEAPVNSIDGKTVSTVGEVRDWLENTEGGDVDAKAYLDAVKGLMLDFDEIGEQDGGHISDPNLALQSDGVLLIAGMLARESGKHFDREDGDASAPRGGDVKAVTADLISGRYSAETQMQSGHGGSAIRRRIAEMAEKAEA